MIDAKPRSPEFMEALKGLHADIAAVIAYGNILPKSVLDAVPMGWYNLHFSNLPKWRGAAPAQRAIWNGDPTLVPTCSRSEKVWMMGQSSPR